jgi:hypothetical protein
MGMDAITVQLVRCILSSGFLLVLLEDHNASSEVASMTPIILG